MKIRFNDDREYKVLFVTYQMNENNVPADIVIYGTKEVLEQIAEYASIGINIQECDCVSAMQSDIWMYYSKHLYEALYARLKPFIIIEADKVQYTVLVK